jgi:ribonuclease BN (tRNA processing enzyme)
MRLTIVGCAPAYTLAAGRASSCYLLEQADEALLLDLGQGAFAELSRYRSPAAVGGVVISHLHPDHFVDLVPLRHYLRYGAGGVAVALRGPADLPQRLDGLMAEQGFIAPLEFAPLAPGSLELAGFQVEVGRVTHLPDSFAFRVTRRGQADTPGLVYSGDCAVAADLAPLLRPGDTLLCEASFGAGPPGPMHLTAAQAGSVAARAGAGRLVLTHILDARDEASAQAAAAQEFGGAIAIAQPGAIFELR